MKNKKILNLYAPKKIDKAIQLCDNLFYGNYLQTGELKTREELQQHIKDEVTQSFVQFWGNHHKDDLIKKISDAKIHFVYQIDGLSNTVSRYLIDLKTQRFNEKYHTEYEAPSIFKTASKMLSGVFVDPVKKLQKLLNSKQIDYTLAYCLDELKFDAEEVLKDNNYAQIVVQQIKTLSKQVKKIKYSDNSKINRNILSLRNLVCKVKKKMDKECKRRGITLRDAFYEELNFEFDPFVARMKFDDNAKVLLTEHDFLGLQDDDCGVYLGIKPGDDTILHEFVHQVDHQGFERNHKDLVKLVYSNELRENEIFNEVITDYFSVLMQKQREADGKPYIVAGAGKDSLYSFLFDKMAKFLDAYLPELKEIRLRELPAEEFQRIIGKKNFDRLAILCNELIAVMYDLDVFDSLKENDQDLNDLIEDGNTMLYGSVDYFMAQMGMLEEAANLTLKKTMRKALAKQPLAKKIDLFLADKSQSIADNLANNKHHKLTKLAPVFANTASVLKIKAQKVAIKKLKKPLHNVSLKQPLLIEDQADGKSMAAEKNTNERVKE